VNAATPFDPFHFIKMAGIVAAAVLLYLVIQRLFRAGSRA